VPATLSSLQRDLTQLGVQSADLLMVHASLRTVGPIIGGANVLIQALWNVIGPQGTLFAYLDFEPFFEDDDPPEAIPAFDKRIAHAARDHGILHETLRNWPGAVRSDHPDAGVVAIGPLAEWLTADHPFHYGYGPGSPFAKFTERSGHVLMLGAPLDTITLLHYAEHLADIPDKRIVRYRRHIPTPNGPQWIDFEEFDTGDPVHDALPQNCFEQIAEEYLAQGHGRSGLVGQGPSYLFHSQHLVQFGTRWLEARINPPHLPTPPPIM
jgi:aminoglycoside 3-N-acetyltransferase